MPSVFEKASKTLSVDLYSREGIEDEVKDSIKTRVKPNPVKNFFRITAVLLFGLILGLYFLDPFLYPIQKTKAMRAMVYLNLYSDPASLNQLEVSGILTQKDIESLKAKDGDYARFFPGGVREAKATAESALDYIHELNAMRNHELDKLGTLNRVRYYLFVNLGLLPPQYWNALNPDVKDIQPPLKPGQFFHIEQRKDRLEYTGVGSGKD